MCGFGSFILGSCALCTDRIKSAFFTNTTGSGSRFFSPDGCVRLVRHFLLFFVKILLFSCTFCQESALKFVCFLWIFFEKRLAFSAHELCIIIIVARSHALAANNIRCSSFTPFSRAFWRRVQYTGYFISRVLMFARKSQFPLVGNWLFSMYLPALRQIHHLGNQIHQLRIPPLCSTLSNRNLQRCTIEGIGILKIHQLNDFSARTAVVCGVLYPTPDSQCPDGAVP